MRRLTELLAAASTGALRTDATHNELAELVAEVRRLQRRHDGRSTRLARLLGSGSLRWGGLGTREQRWRKEKFRMRIDRLLRGEPAFQPRNSTGGNPSDGGVA
jgi:hypothetical protein